MGLLAAVVVELLAELPSGLLVDGAWRRAMGQTAK